MAGAPMSMGPGSGVAAAPTLPSQARAAMARWLGYSGFWVVLMPSLKPGDLVFGALAAAAAAWLSMRLLPPQTGQLRFGVLLTLLPHFVWESVRAGIDVARRALAPTLSLHPGFVRFAVGFPPGLARNRFAVITSLMPGTVPAGEDADTLLYHCLDVQQPVLAQLAAEAARFGAALHAGRAHE